MKGAGKPAVSWGFPALFFLFKFVFYIRANTYKVYYQFALCVLYD